MNKVSELFKALESDQEKALERFYKEWDEIAKDDNCIIIVDSAYIRVFVNGLSPRLCPIQAVYNNDMIVVKANMRLFAYWLCS